MEAQLDELKSIIMQLQQDVKISNEKLDILMKIKKNIVNEWSVENYANNSILIKFTYDISFKNMLKDFGGTWIVTKKGWKFRNTEKESICNALTEAFSDWKFTEIY